MKKFFGVLRYVKGYWRFAIWNIIFNIFSVGIPILFFSTKKDSLITSLKKDSVHTTKSGTTQKQNKKKPDPFW